MKQVPKSNSSNAKGFQEGRGRNSFCGKATVILLLLVASLLHIAWNHVRSKEFLLNKITFSDLKRQPSEIENEEYSVASSQRQRQEDEINPRGKIDDHQISAMDLSTAHVISNDDEYDGNNMRLSNLTEEYVSVDYVTCCGLGHRLIRMSCAYHLARTILQADLRTYWGWCVPPRDENAAASSPSSRAREVFNSLFEPDDIKHLVLENSKRMNASNNNHSRYFNVRYSVANNVNGYFEATRLNLTGDNTTTCRCHDDKIASDYEFYSGLLTKRYRHRTFIDTFVQQNFANYTVYGLHVRAGNGEQGDFAEKQRGLQQNASEYVKFVAQAIMYQYHKASMNTQLPPPLLYIATDTPEYITLFRQEFNNVMPVLDLPQERTDAGVFFGQYDQGSNSVEQCLQRWRDAINDMMLLSHADVVIAGRPSSFIQSMPMSVAFGKSPQSRRMPEVYCEVQGWSRAEAFECYRSYHEWCCETASWLGKEFVQFPADLDSHQALIPTPQERPIDRKHCRPHPQSGQYPRDYCLPHDWSVDGF